MNLKQETQRQHEKRKVAFEAEYPHFYAAPLRAAGNLLISAGLGIGTDVALQHFANAHTWEAVLAGTVIGGANEVRSMVKGGRRFARASKGYVEGPEAYDAAHAKKDVPGHPIDAFRKEYGRVGIKAAERIVRDAIVVGGLTFGGWAGGGTLGEQVHHGNEVAVAGAVIGGIASTLYERRQMKKGQERAARVYGNTKETVQKHAETRGVHLLEHLPIFGEALRRGREAHKNIQKHLK